MDDSWRTYEQYTAPLGVGFMVRPGHHYGPDVDGYEFTPWGTYESLEQCPDELLLFFHHVPYGHVLHDGSTLIQHIYDTHFAGVERVAEMQALWEQAADLVAPGVRARVSERLGEQLRCAEEWRDQINTYFFRKSGVPDARGRRIY